MIGFNIVHHGKELDQLCQLVVQEVWPGCEGKLNLPFAALAVVEDDNLLAAMIYHNYDGDAGVMEISGAAWSKRWLTRPALHMMWRYPIEIIGCQAVVLRVPDENKPLHRMLKSYGCEQYVIPRLRGRDKPDNIFILTDDAWREDCLRKKAKANIERLKNGKESSESSRSSADSSSADGN